MRLYKRNCPFQKIRKYQAGSGKILTHAPCFVCRLGIRRKFRSACPYFALLKTMWPQIQEGVKIILNAKKAFLG
jgi:hypothetical protein